MKKQICHKTLTNRYSFSFSEEGSRSAREFAAEENEVLSATTLKRQLKISVAPVVNIPCPSVPRAITPDFPFRKPKQFLNY